MNRINVPFDFVFEFNGELIPVNAAFLPPQEDGSTGTFAYRSEHPTFIKVYNSNFVWKAYEALSNFHEETEKVLFTHKLCLASCQKLRKHFKQI
jgi:hypothetical protein